MKHFFPFLFLLLAACSQQTDIQSVEANVSKIDYALNFDISKVDYQAIDESSTYSINAIQATDYGFKLESLSQQDIIHYYFNHPVSDDSLNLIGSLYFENQDQDLFNTQELLLQFVFPEAKSNLIQLPDSTYTYQSNLALHSRLSEIDWNNQKLFTENNFGQFIMTVPNSTNLDMNWHPADYLSSNGFYFDYETLNIETIEFDYITGDITLIGNFNVDLKILSCGFYSFFRVENANFEAKILSD